MNVELETLPNCLATLKVEVPSDIVARERERVIQQYRSQARLPGFRPGKAPLNVIAAKFKKGIEEELTSALLSRSTREAIKEKSLRVLSIDDVRDIEFTAQETFRYTARLITAPEFELPDYKNLSIPEPSLEVTDAEIDEVLERMRDQAADFKEITDRALANDDYAIIDYTGTIDGQPASQVSERSGNILAGKTDFWLLVSDNSFLPGFCPNLVGMHAEETREFDITLPEDFPAEELRSRQVHFTATLRGIRERVLPELTDEFANSIEPGKTLEELKTAIRQQLSMSKVYEVEREKRDAVITELLKRVDFELPDAMVRQEMQRILSDIVRENQSRGVTEEELQDNKQQLVEGATAGARNRLKSTFILGRIAAKENIKVSETELNTRIVALARRYKMTPEKLKKELTKRGALDQVQDEILTGKVLDFLVDSGSVPANSGTTSDT